MMDYGYIISTLDGSDKKHFPFFCKAVSKRVGYANAISIDGVIEGFGGKGTILSQDTVKKLGYHAQIGGKVKNLIYDGSCFYIAEGNKDVDGYINSLMDWHKVAENEKLKKILHNVATAMNHTNRSMKPIKVRPFERFNVSDDSGNRLSCDDEGNLTLKLKEKSRSRKLGRIIVESSRVIYYKEEKEKDTFRKNDSWSICYEILKHLNDHDGIVFESEERKYSISVSDAKSKGSFLWFRNEGFEKKIYVTKDNWA